MAEKHCHKEKDFCIDTELTGRLKESKPNACKDFVQRTDLEPDEQQEHTVYIWDDGQLISIISRQGTLLKCIAADDLKKD